MSSGYKKMAGTAAVFLMEEHKPASPVERDGLVWQADELHLDKIPQTLTPRPAMANAIALEGLEDYEPANNGDVREVISLNAQFVYIEQIKGWVELQH